MQRARLVASALIVWLSSCFSLPLKLHLAFMLFDRQALKDGQYFLVLALGIVAGVFAGLVLVALTVILTMRKPQFAQTALWSALGYDAFWMVVTTTCEAIFVGWRCVGYGVLGTLFFMPLSLILSPFFLSAPNSLPWLLGALAALLPLVIVLLIAFYFTPLRGWGAGSRS